MDRTVDIIVKKAQMQEPFAFMYANLCKKITNTWNSILIESATNDSSESAAAGAAEEKESNSYGKQFRFKLLSRCQQEFQVDRAAAIAAIRARTDLSEEDREEQEILMKMRFNGHMRFVGEIYAQDLVKANIMIACLKEFISAPDEANLVCMCRLFETLGKKLEDYCISKKKTRHFTEIFDEIQKLIDTKEGTFSSRVRYLLKDLIDLRANKWQPRIQVQKASKVSQEKEQPAPKSTPKPGMASGDARKGTPGLSVNIPASGSKTPPPASPSDWQVVPPKNKGKETGTAKGAMSRSASTSVINEKKSPFGSNSAKPSNAVNNKFATLDENSPMKSKSSGSSSGIKNSKSFSGQVKADIPAFSPKRESDKKGEEEVEIDFLSNSKEEEEETVEIVDISSSAELPEGFQKKVIGRVNEYYLKEATVAEVCADVKDYISPSSNLPSAAVKIILGYVVEASESHRLAACDMLNYLVHNNIILSDQFTYGLYYFLDVFDDLLVDNPKLLSSLSPMFARFCAIDSILSLNMLKSLPDGNMFSKVSDLIAGTLQSIAALVSVEKAKAVYAELDYDFSEVSTSPDVITAYLKKFHIDTIVVLEESNNTI